MKLKILLLFYLLSFSFECFSQGWTSTTIKPHLISLDFPDEITGYILSNQFDVFKTTNTGISWEHVYNPSAADVLNIKLLNDSVGFTSGDAGVFKTTNSGLNWEVNQSPALIGSVYDISFINSQTGFACDFFYGRVYRTSNQGANWLLSSVLPGIAGNTIQFVNEQTGYLSGEGIRKTTDGGNTWSDIGFNSKSIIKISFSNPDTGYALSFSHIYRTTNGGTNWSTQFYDSTAFFYSIHFPSAKTGYACGGNGMILKSSNAGSTWIRQATNTSDDLHDIYFLNNNTGIACGWEGTVLRTTNGGEPVSISPISSELTNKFVLHQNYPNPFNPESNIRFDVPAASFVKIKIFDITGKIISELLNERLVAGTYKIKWNGSAYPSGVYFYTIEAEDFTETKKMMLLK